MKMKIAINFETIQGVFEDCMNNAFIKLKMVVVVNERYCCEFFVP